MYNMCLLFFPSHDDVSVGTMVRIHLASSIWILYFLTLWRNHFTYINWKCDRVYPRREVVKYEHFSSHAWSSIKYKRSSSHWSCPLYQNNLFNARILIYPSQILIICSHSVNSEAHSLWGKKMSWAHQMCVHGLFFFSFQVECH